MSGLELLPALAAVAGVGSTILGTMGQLQQAKAAGITAKTASAQQAIAAQQADRIERDAGQERAAAQRAAMEERRQGRLVSSRARAVAGASGAGAFDPTMIDILSDIDTEAEFRALTALYEGGERARSAEDEARLIRAGGAITGKTGKQMANSQRTSALLGAGGTLMEGGASLYEKYSRGLFSGYG